MTNFSWLKMEAASRIRSESEMVRRDRSQSIVLLMNSLVTDQKEGAKLQLLKQLSMNDAIIGSGDGLREYE